MASSKITILKFILGEGGSKKRKIKDSSYLSRFQLLDVVEHQSNNASISKMIVGDW
ncbi:hypothetical protein EMIT079MI2_30224 [Bacillus sp. IT-79MI2]